MFITKDIQKAVRIQIKTYGANSLLLLSSNIPQPASSSHYCSGLGNLFIFSYSRAIEQKSFLLHQNTWVVENKAIILASLFY